MNQDLRELSDEMLIAILDRRVELESDNEAEMIDFIREVMSRRLYLQFGGQNMFDFLTRAHYHYAPVVAQRKLDAARLMQIFPEIKRWIASGEMNLTQLGILASAFRQNKTVPKIQAEVLDAVRSQTVKNTQVITRTEVSANRAISCKLITSLHAGKAAAMRWKTCNCFVAFTIVTNTEGRWKSTDRVGGSMQRHSFRRRVRSRASRPAIAGQLICRDCPVLTVINLSLYK